MAPRQSWENKYFKTLYIKLKARRQIFRLYSWSELHLLRGTSMLKISWIDTSLSTKAVLWPPKLPLFFQTEWHMVFLVGERLISLCWLWVHPPASVSEEMDCFGLTECFCKEQEVWLTLLPASPNSFLHLCHLINLWEEKGTDSLWNR